MTLHFALLVLAFGDGLRVDLIAEMTGGVTPRPELEIALIAEGLESDREIADYTERFDEFYSQLSAGPFKGSGKKLAKNIQKGVLERLEAPGSEGGGFVDLIDNQNFTPLSALYLYVRLASEQGVAAGDLALDSYLKPYLMEGGKPEPRSILSAHLVQFAMQKGNGEAAAIGEILQVSRLLAPDASYGAENASKVLYNRALNLFNEKQVAPAGHLAAGGAARWPGLDAWHSLCFNVAVNLLRDGDVKYDDLIRQHQPHMGELSQRFKMAVDSQAYNRAALLYNGKKYAEALAILEKMVKPDSPSDYRTVLADSYVHLIEADEGAGSQSEAWLAKLEKLDPEKADLTRRRLAQLQLAAQVQGGDLEGAFTEAVQHLETKLDRDNFQTVLVRLSQKKRGDWDFQAALDLLDRVPAEAGATAAVDRLRFNTYTDWLATFADTDYKGLSRLYEHLFADKKLVLSDENRALFRDNYGNALYQQIRLLIEEREFVRADAESKAALNLVPGHAALLEQRKLVDTIMKRLSE